MYAKIWSIICVLTSVTSALLNFGLISESIAPVGITSLNAIGPLPSVLSVLPSPTTEITLVQEYVFVPAGKIFPVASVPSLSKYFPVGATNLIKLPGSIKRNPLPVNVPTWYVELTESKNLPVL